MHWARPVAPESAPALLALLDDHERASMAALRRDEDRARYLAAHALARLVLAELVGQPPAALAFDRRCRCGATHGKPRLLWPGLTGFSITHSGDLVGVAVAASLPIGLDVEQEQPLPDLEPVTELVRAPGETVENFFLTWTRKEALLKATGAGLSGDMSAIALGPGPRVVRWTGRWAPAEPMWVRDVPTAVGYRAAVAGPGAPPPLTVGDGDALLRSWMSTGPAQPSQRDATSTCWPAAARGTPRPGSA